MSLDIKAPKGYRKAWRGGKRPSEASPPRPAGSNADEWALFLSEHRDATEFVAVQIAEAIDDHRKAMASARHEILNHNPDRAAEILRAALASARGE